MVKGPHNKEVLKADESAEVKKQQTPDQKAESATAAVESGTLREAFGVLNESGESAEDGVEAMGHVSEKSSEGRERKGDGVAASSKGDDDDAQQKAEKMRQKLINSKPSKAKMLNDIRKHFKAEKRVLKKDLRKYSKTGDWHRYNGVIAKLRRIKETISNLAHATYDALKNAWLKVVHGIV